MKLFKNTYVDLDLNINLNIDRIVVSVDHGFPAVAPLVEGLPGKLIAYGLSISDVLSQKNYSSLTEILEECYNSDSDKIVIYCDTASYHAILTYWFKLIFPNINSDAGRLLIESMILKYFFKSGAGWTLNPDYYNSSIPSRDSYTELFNSIADDSSKATSLLSKISNDYGLDFLIISYLYNSTHKEQLKTQIHPYINLMACQFCRLLWKKICSPILVRKTIQDKFNITATESSFDYIISIEKNPSFQNFLNLASNDASIDFTTLSLDQINDIKQKIDLLKNILLNNDSFVELNRLHSYIEISSEQTISDENLDVIINYELFPPDNAFGITNMIPDKNIINPYILEYAYEAKRNNQIELLAPYLLR
jgi:hypothetical protein